MLGDIDRVMALTKSDTSSECNSASEMTLECATIDSNDSVKEGSAQQGSSANYSQMNRKSKLDCKSQTIYIDGKSAVTKAVTRINLLLEKLLNKHLIKLLTKLLKVGKRKENLCTNPKKP